MSSPFGPEREICDCCSEYVDECSCKPEPSFVEKVAQLETQLGQQQAQINYIYTHLGLPRPDEE